MSTNKGQCLPSAADYYGIPAPSIPPEPYPTDPYDRLILHLRRQRDAVDFTIAQVESLRADRDSDRHRNGEKPAEALSS